MWKNIMLGGYDEFEIVTTFSKKIKLYHKLSVWVYAIIYIILLLIMVYVDSGSKGLWFDFFGRTIYKNVICGILAQLQVIMIILIALTPTRKSNLLALSLCLISAVSSSYAAMIEKNMEVLPGIGINISSIIIILIISKYNINLNNQISKVIRYNQIVEKNDELLQKLAFYDSLTELPNRKKMIDQIETLTDPTMPEKSSFIFVYLDMDNFKKINDSAGHNVGDAILKQVSLRLKEKCNKEDLLGRVGGDEFALIIRRNLNRNQIASYLENIKVGFSEAILVDRKEFFIGASFGITRYPEDGSNADELFTNADIALNKAKNSGKNEYRFFTKEMQGEVLRKIKLENGLLSSIRNNELYIVFQPQFICGTKTLRGYEALIRWKYPELGLIGPSQFIPIAEETGMIIEMGKWIINSVLRKFMDFRSKMIMSPVISINISVVQMKEPSFVDMVSDILQSTGFNASFLEFEITESVFITCPEHIIDVIRQLKELGIRIALDDFGTGYASLNYLQILPIDILKIDKSFIDQIVSHRPMNHIIGNIIALSHQLGIKVVAEGVEVEEQLQYLAEHNCDYIQGYLLSKPMEEKELEKSFQ